MAVAVAVVVVVGATGEQGVGWLKIVAECGGLSGWCGSSKNWLLPNRVNCHTLCVCGSNEPVSCIVCAVGGCGGSTSVRGMPSGAAPLDLAPAGCLRLFTWICWRRAMSCCSQSGTMRGAPAGANGSAGGCGVCGGVDAAVGWCVGCCDDVGCSCLSSLWWWLDVVGGCSAGVACKWLRLACKPLYVAMKLLCCCCCCASTVCGRHLRGLSWLVVVTCGRPKLCCFVAAVGILG